jgi:hypothetical protein
MNVRTVALIFGIVFLLVGVAGFIPGLLQEPHPDDPALAVDAMHGRLFGLFPVNVLHDVVHILFGIAGLAAYRSVGSSVLYLRAVAVIYAVLVVMGLIPGLNTTLGLIPLHGNDVWLHAVLALVAGLFGFRSVDRDVRTGV